MMGRKEKKEKPVYVDDGGTIADMSGVTGGFMLPPRAPGRAHPSFKEAWKTYWSAVRMMLAPTMVAIAGIGIIYLIVTIIFRFL